MPQHGQFIIYVYSQNTIIYIPALLYPEQQRVKDIGRPEQKCQLCYKLRD